MAAAGLNTFRTNYMDDPADNATLAQAVQHAKSKGMTPLLIVQSVAQAQEAAKQFGSSANYEFLNEAYSGDSGSTAPYPVPTPAAYANEAKQAYQDVKAISPQSQFLIDGGSGSYLQWTEQVIQDMKGEFDGVSIHPYGVWAPSNQNQPTAQDANNLAPTISYLETSLTQANNGTSVTLDITETGWNNPQS